MEADLVNGARSLELAHRVRILGAVTDRIALRNVLMDASVLCVPSRRENFGTVYAEAMACGAFAAGCPSSVMEIARTLGLDCAIAIEAQDAAEIASAIEAAHNLETDRELLSARARERYSPERCAEDFVRALEG